ncbi:MAG: CPBP family intramembrane metalloprotease [Gemmataceae bacterium]|nr:CPBP family intramembrane metalloprotease [Gemmataceae bacterium]
MELGEKKMLPWRYTSYLQATRHPWPNFLFLLPLVAIYEMGVVLLGDSRGSGIRNGADWWLRDFLQQQGVTFIWFVPLALLFYFGFQSFLQWWSRPFECAETIGGILLEGGIFGVSLWFFSQAWGNSGVFSVDTRALPNWITLLGAGIYEETIFRLLAFQGLLLLFPRKGIAPVGFGVVASAIFFASAHHLGASGESWVTEVFVFRLLAGIFLGLIYYYRGFAIAIGSHVIYDLIVAG